MAQRLVTLLTGLLALAALALLCAQRHRVGFEGDLLERARQGLAQQSLDQRISVRADGFDLSLEGFVLRRSDVAAAIETAREAGAREVDASGVRVAGAGDAGIELRSPAVGEPTSVGLEARGLAVNEQEAASLRRAVLEWVSPSALVWEVENAELVGSSLSPEPLRLALPLALTHPGSRIEVEVGEVELELSRLGASARGLGVLRATRGMSLPPLKLAEVSADRLSVGLARHRGGPVLLGVVPTGQAEDLLAGLSGSWGSVADHTLAVDLPVPEGFGASLLALAPWIVDLPEPTLVEEGDRIYVAGLVASRTAGLGLWRQLRRVLPATVELEEDLDRPTSQAGCEAELAQVLTSGRLFEPGAADLVAEGPALVRRALGALRRCPVAETVTFGGQAESPLMARLRTVALGLEALHQGFDPMRLSLSPAAGSEGDWRIEIGADVSETPASIW